MPRLSFIPLRSSSLAIACLLAVGCTLFEDEKKEGDNIEITTGGQVLSIVAPANGEPGTMVVRNVHHYCEQGQNYADTIVDTSSYHIADGKLYIWTNGNCNVSALLSGSSSTITGTWTTSDLMAAAQVPAAFRDPDCDDEDEEGDAILKDASLTYEISATKVTSTAKGTVCFAPVFAEGFTEVEGIEVVSTGCASVKIRDTEENKTATISASYKNGKIVTTFSHGSSTCSFSFPLDDSREQVCTEEDDGTMEFSACMAGSGFYGETGLEKSGVAKAHDFGSALRRGFSLSR